MVEIFLGTSSFLNNSYNISLCYFKVLTKSYKIIFVGVVFTRRAYPLAKVTHILWAYSKITSVVYQSHHCHLHIIPLLFSDIWWAYSKTYIMGIYQTPPPNHHWAMPLYRDISWAYNKTISSVYSEIIPWEYRKNYKKNLSFWTR